MPGKKILIIEDDRELARGLSEYLTREGYVVSHASDGQSGLHLARASLPDLIVLDLNLPVKQGLDVCLELRSFTTTRDIPIILATDHDEESDQLVGFALGADDFLVKPYSWKVLNARIQYHLHRRKQSVRTDHTVLESQGVVVDHFEHRATLHGRDLPLTPTEFRLLGTLLRRPGRIFTRDELRVAAFGEEADVQDNTINVYIKSLRGKLGEAAALIETVRFVGYRFRVHSYVEN